MILRWLLHSALVLLIMIWVLAIALLLNGCDGTALTRVKCTDRPIGYPVPGDCERD